MRAAKGQAKLFCDPTREAVLSWNTNAPEGDIAVRILRAHQPDGLWLPHAKWSAGGRHSFSAKDHDVVIETDVITALHPFDGLEIQAPGVEFTLLGLSVPTGNSTSVPGQPVELDVPQRSQYVQEGQRGWCSPASLSMINAFYGFDIDVRTTAQAVFDGAYNGTGNWSFNVAYSGSLGLQGVVAYLRNFAHAQQLLQANIPVALSYSWSPGELPGAPIKHSDGHLCVLRGFDRSGDPILNDPAAPRVRVTYPRAALEAIWLRNKGVAFVIAPRGVDLELLLNS